MIDTARLVLRPWRASDREPFAAMGRDPEVMAHLGPLLARTEADDAVDRMNALQTGKGYCFWAVEERATGAFLGFCGLKDGPAGTPIERDIEIGWRLKHDAWGKGFAREAAQASLDWGFANLDCLRIAAITVAANTRSWGLMERLGMTRRPDLDFDHPNLAPGDPLRAHVTYVMER
jgi:RimJ/RimL family protein N-acetyltransferase